MRASEIAAVSSLLCDSYELLASREALSPEQTRFLLAERGSVECVRRESRREQYLVARDLGRIVGMVAVRGAKITKLYVAPDRTGEGIGRLLYRAAEAVARAAGERFLTLHAFPTAVPFYQRMGLSVVAYRNATGALEGLHVALMEKDLNSDAI